ncbi:MAG TPA: lysylphosphatidylglycerol synthase transmembrane domain-containing protein [Acidimicrobiia bacterium]|nr:lysylphosphatidylglycerol synthase transmembrane domain-containing protein [Acidimicrobiia bacterium]
MTEEDAPPRRSGGAGWKLALRIIVSVALLVVLARNLRNPTDAIPGGHHLVTTGLLVGALLMTLLGVVLSAWRWQRVLMVFDVQPSLRTLTRHYLAGLFVGNALPGTIGGDVLRVSRLSTSIESSTTAFASVVLERLTGFLALPAFVLLGFVVRPSLLDHNHAWIALLIAGITLTVLAVILFAAGHSRVAGRFADNDNWTRFIGAVHVGVDRLRRDPRQAFPVLATAFVYQLSVISVFGLIFRALDLPVPLAALFAFAPAVLMVQVLPISLSGLGVREGALVLFLHPLGVSREQAFAAGLLWWGALLIVSMLGAPAFAIGHRRRTRAERPA